MRRALPPTCRQSWMRRRLRWHLALRCRRRRHLHAVLDAVGAVRDHTLTALEPLRDLGGRVSPSANRDRLLVRDVLRIDDEDLEPLAVGHERAGRNRDGIWVSPNDDLAA